jgi:hypothetical protein
VEVWLRRRSRETAAGTAGDKLKRAILHSPAWAQLRLSPISSPYRPSELLQTMANFSPLSTDELAVNTIRTLAADVVAKANSGHPVSQPDIPLLDCLPGPPPRTI